MAKMHGTIEGQLIMTLLTRKDAYLGEGLYDSIAWAFSEHVQQPDNPRYNSAVLHGNQDCPEKIEFFTHKVLKVHHKPAFTWVRDSINEATT